jgi:1-deoxy-D-xylulose-5-phosphate synthase
MRRTAFSKERAVVKATAEGGWDKISTDELTDWQQQGPPTPLLDTVNFPVHIKNFNARQLKQLCKELRAGKKSALCQGVYHGPLPRYYAHTCPAV